MKKSFRNVRVQCLTLGVLASLLLLPLSSSHAAQDAVIPAAVTQEAPHQYWRTGNPQDAHTKAQSGFALIGGGKNLDAAFSWLCEQSNGGDFLVLSAAGADVYGPYLHTLCHENSVATLLIPSHKAALDPEVQKKIRSAQAIFVSGGDQAKYVNFWQNTPVQRAIRDAIKRGVPVGGTSAGLAVLGQFSYSAQEDPVGAPDLNSAMALQNPYLSRVTIIHDFLNIPALHGTITETHFSRRDRMGRLLVFMSRILQAGDAKSIQAIAVDENAAVLLKPDGKGTVVGKGAAYFLRASSKPKVCQPGEPLTFEKISVIKMSAGTQFDTVAWSGPGIQYELSVSSGTIHSTQVGDATY